jgi:hypothetical protein
MKPMMEINSRIPAKFVKRHEEPGDKQNEGKQNDSRRKTHEG